jgi:hypothetical protein
MEYTPGVCNIGMNEVRKRYTLAAASFAVTAVILYAILSSSMPHLVLLVSLIPLVIGFEGFYQGYLHFCAGFAAGGIYDFTGSGGSRNRVTDPKAHKKDMRMANKIHAYSILSALVITAVIYFSL